MRARNNLSAFVGVLISMASLSAMATEVTCQISSRDVNGKSMTPSTVRQTVVDGKAKLTLGVTDAGWDLMALYFDENPGQPGLIAIGATKDIIFGTSGHGSANMKIAGRHIFNTYEIDCSAK